MTQQIETVVVFYRGIRIERVNGSTTWGFAIRGMTMGRQSLDAAKRAIDSKLREGK